MATYEDKDSIKSFKDLKCWQAGREVRKYISKVVKTLPADEKYALVTQMRNASRSVTHNMAEGYGRYGFRDNANFCRTSRASCYEVIDQLITAFDEGYIDDAQLKDGEELCQKTIRITNGYISYLVKRSNEVKEPAVQYGLDEEPLLTLNN